MLPDHTATCNFEKQSGNKVSPDHTATCNFEKQSGRVLMKLLYPGFLLRTTEWKREPSYLLPQLYYALHTIK